MDSTKRSRKELLDSARRDLDRAAEVLSKILLPEQREAAERQARAWPGPDRAGAGR